MLQESLLVVLQRCARCIQCELRGSDGVGGALHVGRHARERLGVEVGEAHLEELRGEEIENGLNGSRDGIHILNIQSVLANGQRLESEAALISSRGPMALTATVHHFEITLSDVDRGVYEVLDLRVARHPSESARYMITRTLAYCLSFEPGIAFSKGGISSTNEPPVAVRDPTGILLAWIDVGAPSAERLHKASKAAQRVALYTHADLALLRREASSRAIHDVENIEVWRLDAKFLDAVSEKVGRTTKLELVRSEGLLYVTVAGEALEGAIASERLV